ncbi:MAG: aspartate 1-decarboxylase [Myxococcota bacterium]
MLRPVLQCKIHMATVTGARPDYVGSITIDRNLLEAAGLRVNDWVLVANCRSGARLETYVFEGEAGSGSIELNGAAAHHVQVRDQVIIMHSALVTDDEYRAHRPLVVLTTPENRVREVLRYDPGPAPR